MAITLLISIFLLYSRWPRWHFVVHSVASLIAVKIAISEYLITLNILIVLVFKLGVANALIKCVCVFSFINLRKIMQIRMRFESKFLVIFSSYWETFNIAKAGWATVRKVHSNSSQVYNGWERTRAPKDLRPAKSTAESQLHWARKTLQLQGEGLVMKVFFLSLGRLRMACTAEFQNQLESNTRMTTKPTVTSKHPVLSPLLLIFILLSLYWCQCLIHIRNKLLFSCKVSRFWLVPIKILKELRQLWWINEMGQQKRKFTHYSVLEGQEGIVETWKVHSLWRRASVT